MARVLLVDDELLVRKVLRVVLEAEGHDVSETGNAEEALAAVARDAPDLVVLDLVLPGADGYDLCAQLKSAAPGARVLVLSSVPVAESAPKAEQAGADDVMTKPFSAMDLLERLSKLLGDR